MNLSEGFRARLDAAMAEGTCGEGMSMYSSIQGRLSAGSASSQAGGFLNTGRNASVSNSPPATVSTAAFGPTASTQGPSTASLLHPFTPTGTAFWVGVGALVALAVIRHSLPA